MENSHSNVVECILTAILQWRVCWLGEQSRNPSTPPPISRTQPKTLKITYDDYKDYETTFVPLLMHEIWSQIFEEWYRQDRASSGGDPMEVDEDINANVRVGNVLAESRNNNNQRNSTILRQIWIGVFDYRIFGRFQCMLRCQYVVDGNKLIHHMKLIGEGDLIKMDLVIPNNDNSIQPSELHVDPDTSSSILSLFGYVVDVNSERIGPHTSLAPCFASNYLQRPHHVVNYHVVIAKRPLRLDLNKPMKITGLYYLKPMLRQIESVSLVKESPLAADILNPKHITCQMTIPNVVTVKSPHFNDMQFKAIVGACEALLRSIPKIQLIQGPPGTGKTHTLVGLIKHFYSNWPGGGTALPKILICAPSNGAIDEVAKRLIKEREFLKKTWLRRSLRLVRIGHSDHISEAVKSISLEELVEANALQRVQGVKKKHSEKIKLLEEELSSCDQQISNLRYLKRSTEIPGIEMKQADLLKKLDQLKASEEVGARREVSDASKKNTRYELVKNADVIMTTLNSCQRHPLESLFKGERSELQFHCVIVDEASQCCEPELLMPLCYKMNKMILIGDPMQLPATVISRRALQFDYGRSLFERFFIHFNQYDQSSPISMLKEQYRMHPEICRFPSFRFYNNRLINAKSTSTSQLSYPISPYQVYDLRHGAESRSSNRSIENEVEAGFVRLLLVAVLTKAPNGSKVGVITPYKGQKRLITHKIQSLQSEKNIRVDVNTCDGFQGQERDIIILSSVRASDQGSIGFLKSVQRINVALTRAKHSLIICLSSKSLSQDATWQALIADATNRRLVQTLTHTPSVNRLLNMICYLPTPLVGLRTNTVKEEPEVIDIELSPTLSMPMDVD